MTEQLKSLHVVWNQTTGQELHFKATERLFYEMLKLDFTPDDLLCVLKHVLAYNKTHAHAPMKVQVHKLLGDLEVFASILGEARAKERNRKPVPTPKQAVMNQLRPVVGEPVTNTGTALTVKEILKKVIQ